MTQAAIAQAATLIRQRSNDAEAAYEAMIKTLAAGGDMQAEKIIEVTEASGRTTDELQADVEKLEGLFDARKQLEGLPQLESRLLAIEGERAALRAELEATQRRIASRDELLSGEFNSTTAAANRLKELQRQITVGKFDLPSQAVKRTEAGKIITKHGMAANNLRTELERERRMVATLETALKRLQGKDHPDANDLRTTTNDLASARRRVTVIEHELQPHEKAIANANAAMAGVSQ